MSTERIDREYIDILKGIGILFIVLGHCYPAMFNFCYLFNVPLFFYISGFLYNETKYGNKPFYHIITKWKNYLKYVVIYSVFVLLHNTFLKIGLLHNFDTRYTLVEICKNLLKIFVLSGNELLCSTLWFVAALLVGIVILGLIVSLSIRISMNRKVVKLIIQLMLVAVFTYLGWIITKTYKIYPAYFNISLLSMPYFYLGYMIKLSWSKIFKYLRLDLAVICFLILWKVAPEHFISLKDFAIEKSMFLWAVLGIYMCLVLAKILSEISCSGIIKKIFALMGRCSFCIMAFHYLIIRCIDYVYLQKKGQMNLLYINYIGTYYEMLPYYLILGIGIPIMMELIYRLIIKILNKKFGKRKNN